MALVDKPPGRTSHDIVQEVRRGLGQSQVGHTGTLDPAATGLMVVTLGRATRLGRFLEATDKAYVGTVRLGRSTTTWDQEGETVQEAPVPPGTFDHLEDVFEGLQGNLEQTVPAFSAVKVDGERLHAKARRGETVEGPKRTVTIHELCLLERTGNDLALYTQVSKGTYIRSLAVEIGQRLNVPAHLAALRRVRVGPHRVEDAHSPARFSESDPPVVRPALALSHLRALTLDPESVEDAAYGRPVKPKTRDFAERMGEAHRILDEQGRLVAVGRPSVKDPRWLQYDVVLIRPEDVAGTV